jgi:hypothetical protein
MPEIRKCVRNLCVFALGLCGGSAQAASEPQIFLDGLETPPTLVVYYVSGEGAHGIYRGRRVDGGWQRGEQVLLDGVFDGDAVDPDVLREPDGSFRLYYFRGHFVTPPPPLPEPSRFYSAHSSDGLNFSIDGEVFALDNSTDPSVVRLPDGRRRALHLLANIGAEAVPLSAEALSECLHFRRGHHPTYAVAVAQASDVQGPQRWQLVKWMRANNDS